MLTPRFPYPPVRGDCVRAWGELQHLAARHDVWLASLSDGPVAPDARRAAEERCRGVMICRRSPALALARGALSLLGGQTVTQGYFADDRLVRQVRRWSSEINFDAVLVFSSAMAPYSRLVPGARRVLDMNDVDSIKWERYAGYRTRWLRWAFQLEAARLAAAERQWCRLHDCTVVVNQREQQRLLARCGAVTSSAVRSGLPLPADLHAADAVPELPSERRVGMVGSMSYPPNIRAALWFAAEVWPRVLAQAPDARWMIIGRDPTRAIRALARLTGVTVTGLVPELAPLLRSLRVFVVPVRDDLGVQTKLIEALAHGRPAVCTRETAGGMDWRGTAPFLIADDAPTFARQVLRILSDDPLAHTLSRAALATAAEFYDVRRQAAEIEQLLHRGPQSAAQPARPAPAEPVRRVG